jgi:uncharacterized RDD family membrane protein YckC
VGSEHLSNLPPPAMPPPPVRTDPTDVLGRRIAAGLIDVGVLFILFIVLAVTIGDTESRSGSGTSSHTVSLTGGPFLVYVGLVLLYYFLLEVTTAASVGKLLLGLRVVGADGGRPSAGAILIRTVLRIVDWLPFFYLVGFVAMLATGTRRKRLGDLAAKTSVGRVSTAQQH